MPELADVLSKDSVHRLHEAFVEGVLWLPRTPKNDFGLSGKTFDRVGPPILRWVHHRLMAQARPSTRHPDWPYEAHTSITQILRDEGVEGARKGQAPRLVGDISRTLQHAGIAFHQGSGKGNGVWYLKPWSDENLEWVSDKAWTKPDPFVEKRIEEEAGKPVHSRIDLRSIKLPGEGPEEVMEFVNRFVPAAFSLQDKYQNLLGELRTALGRIADLEAQVEAQSETEEWKGVSTRIKELFGQKSE